MQAYREEVGFLLKRSRRNISMRDHILIMSGLLYEELPGSCLRYMTGSGPRSEEHTSELQSRLHLVCRLLLEKKNSEIEMRKALLYETPKQSIIDKLLAD